MGKKLRILMVSNNYTPYSGGVVSSLNAQVDELIKCGHQVQIATLDFGTDESLDPKHVTRLYCPIKKSYNGNPVAIPWQATAQLEKIIAYFSPNIIHVHHPVLLGKAALTAAQTTQVPVVFTYHTMYERYLHYFPLPQRITRKILKKRLKSFCSNVHGIVAPSSFIKQHLLTLANTTPCAVIPSGILPIFFNTDICNKTASHPLRLLTVSRFAKEKDIHLLLDLFALLDDEEFTFTLAGYGPEYEPMKEYAYVHLGLSKRAVKFIHMPTKSELVELYQQADLFLFASSSDTQALVLAEAMSAGLPVIALDGPGQRDIVRDGHNGYLISTITEMRQVILDVAEDQELAAQLRQGAFEVGQAYRPEKRVEELVQFYEGIVNSSQEV